MISNRIRFSGMASGMDTDSIVKDMMRPQQYKIDMQKKEQALVQLRQDAWKDMNKKLYDFHTKFTHKLSLASTYDKNITTTSNAEAIEIAKDTKIPQGTHVFNISQIAEAPSMAGQITTLENKVIDNSTKVGDLIKFPANIKKDKDGKQELTLQIILNEGSEEKKIIDIKVGEKDTLNSLQAKMKEQGIDAKYDPVNGMFFVNSNKTGANETITFTAPDAEVVDEENKLTAGQKQEQRIAGRELLRSLGLLQEGKMSTTVKGKDAKYTYGNGSKVFESATNKIEINGIQAIIKATTTEAITISSVADPDATYAFVKEFVTEYNKLLDEINTKIGTKPAKNIQPLTAEERKAMSDSDIKLWEDKLNSSLFYKDEQLTNFVNSARSILNGAIGGKTLASIGIVTGPWDEKGKLHIEGDEDDTLYAGRTNKLKAEIEKDPQAVKDLLLGLGKKLYEDHNKTLTTSSKLKSAMNFYNDKLMADKVKTFDKQILTLEDRMYKMEETQYRKFAAMEKMLSSLNSQGSWLSQQFGG